MDKENKKIGLKRLLENNLFILKYAYKLLPIYYTFYIASETILSICFGLINVAMMKYAIDAVMEKRDFNEVIKVLLGFAIGMILLLVFAIFSDTYNEYKSKGINLRV